MKKFFIAMTLFSITLLSCHKNKEADFIIPKNAELTVHGKGKMDIRASDVYSKYSELKRKIELINAEDKKVIGEAFITVSCSNRNASLYDIITNNPEQFTGEISIQIAGQIVYLKKIKKGIQLKAGNLAYREIGPVHNPAVQCTVSTVHDCVAYELEGMNWVKMIICFANAPGCYIEQWLSCQWEVCHNHMQYTNPN